MTELILAIDPGDVQSAYVLIDAQTYKPVQFAKLNNDDCLEKLLEIVNLTYLGDYKISGIAIEMVASYGMAVGKSVFETCVWIGRFTQFFTELVGATGVFPDYIYRKDEKMNICGQMKAKDSNIRVALIDRFAKFDFKTGKGTKTNPDFFYGFAKDIWAAYAVGVTWLDMHGYHEKDDKQEDRTLENE